MSRRLPAALLALALATTLAACGDDAKDEGTSDSKASESADASASPEPGTSGAEANMSGIEVAGDLGAAPEVTWEKLAAEETGTSVLIEGDGAEVAENDQVEVFIWIGSGSKAEKTYSTHDNGTEPESLAISDQVIPVLKNAILGKKIGSRVAVTAPVTEAFTSGAQVNLEDDDSVLILIDIMGEFVPPAPTEVPANQVPKIVEEGGKVTSLDFAGLPEPKADGELLRHVVKEGDGEVVTETMTVTANYLGQVYGAEAPFDESYSKEPAEFSLQGVVKGWTYGLSGVKVGSRVLLSIPSDLGYGDAGQPAAGIKGGDTLYFVVDIVSAK